MITILKQEISKLIELVNLEREAEISAMKNEIKRFSPEKREAKGRAINNLNGKYIGKELGYNLVQFGRKYPIETEIAIGDLVLISKGNPLKSDLTGTVTEKGNRYIKVAIENLPKWAKKKHIRIDLYASDISFKRMEENLKNLSEEGKKALKLSINKKEIKTKPNNKKTKKQKNNDPILIDKLLNDSQKIAISKAKESKDFYLIHGPFGTGKTRTLIELIKEESNEGNKVLTTAESNTAVDNLLTGLIQKKSNSYEKNEYLKDLNYTRLGHPQRVSKENIKYSLAYKAEEHPMNEEKEEIFKEIEKLIKEREEFTKPSPRYRRGFSDKEIIANGKKKISSRGIPAKIMISMSKWLELNLKINEKYNHIESIDNEIIQDIIKKSDVILATNSSAALEYIQNIKFDIAIIDEASQTTIPSILIPIAKAKKFILAGDHKQLPPTVTSSKCEELTNTLFEKLIKKYTEKSTILKVQYRMNKELMEFPNKEFYENQLKSESFISNISLSDLKRDLPKNKNKKSNDKTETKKKAKNKFNKTIANHFKELEKTLNNNDQTILFIDTSEFEKHGEERLKDSKSIRNKSEAEITQLIVNNYIKSGFSNEDIGVISPYYDQVDLLKSRIKNIEIKTVDGFQGREKEIMIISTVRSNEEMNIGFLNDLRRLNVAITRGKRKLIIIGNSYTLKSNKTYAKLIKYYKSKEAFKIF